MPDTAREKAFNLQKTHTDALFEFPMERRAAVLEVIISNETDYPPMSVFQKGVPALTGQIMGHFLRPLDGVQHKAFGVKDNLLPGDGTDLPDGISDGTGRLGWLIQRQS